MLIEMRVEDKPPMRVTLPADGFLVIHGVEIRTGRAMPELPPCPACAENRQHKAEEFVMHHPVSVTQDNRH